MPLGWLLPLQQQLREKASLAVALEVLVALTLLPLLLRLSLHQPLLAAKCLWSEAPTLPAQSASMGAAAHAARVLTLTLAA
jgi:hypothetical protein